MPLKPPEQPSETLRVPYPRHPLPENYFPAKFYDVQNLDLSSVTKNRYIFLGLAQGPHPNVSRDDMIRVANRELGAFLKFKKDLATGLYKDNYNQEKFQEFLKTSELYFTALIKEGLLDKWQIQYLIREGKIPPERLGFAKASEIKARAREEKERLVLELLAAIKETDEARTTAAETKAKMAIIINILSNFLRIPEIEKIIQKNSLARDLIGSLIRKNLCRPNDLPFIIQEILKSDVPSFRPPPDINEALVKNRAALQPRTT